jgi:hypothetical protein
MEVALLLTFKTWQCVCEGAQKRRRFVVVA